MDFAVVVKPVNVSDPLVLASPLSLPSGPSMRHELALVLHHVRVIFPSLVALRVVSFATSEPLYLMNTVGAGVAATTAGGARIVIDAEPVPARVLLAL